MYADEIGNAGTFQQIITILQKYSLLYANTLRISLNIYIPIF